MRVLNLRGGIACDKVAYTCLFRPGSNVMDLLAERYEELEKLVSEILVDLRKFYDDGNEVAGTRARKGLLALKNWVHEVRKEISAERAKAEASGSSKGAAKSKSVPAKKAPSEPKEK